MKKEVFEVLGKVNSAYEYFALNDFVYLKPRTETYDIDDLQSKILNFKAKKLKDILIDTRNFYKTGVKMTQEEFLATLKVTTDKLKAK